MNRESRAGPTWALRLGGHLRTRSPPLGAQAGRGGAQLGSPVALWERAALAPACSCASALPGRARVCAFHRSVIRGRGGSKVNAVSHIHLILTLFLLQLQFSAFDVGLI
ncbi:hypothetical protein AAFF_G00114090 [Aldrovandia affinis]|uniref:Uncharacterized protein n=1 Tax=Aldrovandia affinis TaxID=143900 RepID=A0AAD7RT73_9TELE|nr:hypothetical protein AAFF_G00114090 [Aldrovandia affinis]